MFIQGLSALEILDSRGNPTVEACMTLENGMQARASVPSGASTGSEEALELRDHDLSRYNGRGVLKAVNNINTIIAKKLIGQKIDLQEDIDELLCKLDGSTNKSNLGANAILAVSLAFAKLNALSLHKPLFETLAQNENKFSLPIPMMNILNGGAHADNNVDIQEFMIMPIGAQHFKDALQMGAEIFHKLKSILKQKNLNTAVGDEGGFAPNLRSNSEALDLLSEAVIKANYNIGKDIVFALDAAASEFYKDGVYYLDNKTMSYSDLVDYYNNLCKSYNIFSIEDALAENDLVAWQEITRAMGDRVQLVGDDLFATNTRLLQNGIENHIANAILIKPNQIGTVTETKAAIAMAQANNYSCIISHRSGETEDTFIASLAVGSGVGQIKTGSLCRTDRIAKYNELLRIEQEYKLEYFKFNIGKL